MGRPPKWDNVKQVQILIDAYFNENNEREWTVTGLALALDTTRDVLIDYQNKDEFSYAIKMAKEKVHNAYEKDLRRKGRSGDIFALKNFGWTDTHQTDITSGGKPIPIYGGIANVPRYNGDKKDIRPKRED